MSETPSSGPTSDATPTPDVPDTMWAWTQDRFGADALERRQIPVPAIEEKQVLVRIASTSLNAADRYQVTCPALAMRPIFGVRGPRKTVPGLDLAGTVVAVGDGVHGFEVGDRVIGEANGAWADYAAAHAANLALAPSSIPLADAGALPIGGLTALQGLRDHGGLEAGSSVLIHGATGAVGSFAVQIAAALGATVTAVCAEDAADLVRSLGAHEIIDREPTERGTVAERLVADGRRFDVVFDVAGVESTRDRGRLLADGGTCVLVGAPSGGSILGPIRPLVATIVASKLVRGRFRSFVASAKHEDLATLSSMVDAGDLRVIVDERFEFEQLPAAFERFATGRKFGKIVVEQGTSDD